MKKLLLALTLMALTTASATDLNATLSDQQAQGYTLTLGPGSLATITLPEPAKNITVTRNGIIETSIQDNRVIIAGVSSTGTTPLQIASENHVWTWRVKMSSTQASSIVNLTVRDAEETTVSQGNASVTPETSAPRPAVSPAAAPTPTPATLNLTRTTTSATAPVPNATPAMMPAPVAPVQPSQVNSSEPAPAMTGNTVTNLTPADLPGVTFTLTRDGNTTVMQYRVHAGARGLAIDERALSVRSPGGTGLTKPNMGSLLLSPDEVRYGTILLSGLDTGTAQVIWPYRVGTVQQSINQNITIP